jgi:hypothetical protein
MKITFLSFAFLMTLSFGTLLSQKYVVPASMKATGYDAHVELTFDNPNAFIYDIYVSKDGGKNFIRRVETNGDFYLDFVNDLGRNLSLLYRIVPKGMNVHDKDAVKFQVKAQTHVFSDDELINMVQQYTTRYFFNFADPDCGMARERNNNPNGDIVTTGGTGFGIMALIAADHRGYYPHQAIFQKINQIVTFLEKADRFHGAWAHWYNGNTGKVFSFSKYDDGGDLVETAFMMEGLLTARQYYDNGNEQEKNLSNRITKLWEGVDWNWYTQGTDSLYWHWSPDYGFKINHRITGFDETMITYVLAASSPTHPIRPEVFKSYSISSYFYNGKSYFGIPLALGMPYGGPLFFCHYSFLGMNPHGLMDKNANYWVLNRNHVLIQRAYAIANPKHERGLGQNCWGFTASDDPMDGYSTHQLGTNEENGTVSPTAALASLPYAPKEILPVYRHFYYDLGKKIFGPYGFYDAFNLGMVDGQQVVHSYLAIDEGPIPVMIENYRSALLWNLFMSNTEIQTGLKKLGFQFDATYQNEKPSVQ